MSVDTKGQNFYSGKPISNTGSLYNKPLPTRPKVETTVEKVAAPALAKGALVAQEPAMPKLHTLLPPPGMYNKPVPVPLSKMSKETVKVQVVKVSKPLPLTPVELEQQRIRSGAVAIEQPRTRRDAVFQGPKELVEKQIEKTEKALPNLKKVKLQQQAAIISAKQEAQNWFVRSSTSITVFQVQQDMAVIKLLEEISAGLTAGEDSNFYIENLKRWEAEVAKYVPLYKPNTALQQLQSLLKGAYMQLCYELKDQSQAEPDKGVKKIEPLNEYNAARKMRQNLEERELRQYLGKHEKLLKDLVQCSSQLRKEDLPLDQRLAQLQVYGKLIKQCSGVLFREIRKQATKHPAIIGKSAWAVSKRVEEAFKKEVTAFASMAALTYRHFEAERRKCEQAFWETHLVADTSEIVKEWGTKSKVLNKTENLEDRKPLLEIYAGLVKVYVEWKETTLKTEKTKAAEELMKKKARGVIGATQPAQVVQYIFGLSRHVKDVNQVKKAINDEQGALAAYFGAKQIEADFK